jgi:GAF domain-containing protein
VTPLDELTAVGADDPVDDGTLDGEPSLRAMLSVGERVARGGDLREVLNDIAREAGQVVQARSASILLLRTEQLFWLGGSWGLSDAYRTALERRLHHTSGGPSGLVVAHRRPVVIADVRSDPRLISPQTAVAEGLRSLVAVPLTVDEELMGVLIAWRSVPDPWTAVDVDLLQLFADHAGNAIRTAALVDRQSRQLDALSRIVRDLRELTHEHANRIHGLSGLIALGETAEARRFVGELLHRHDESHRAILERIEHPGVAGLLLAEMTIARQQGIQLRIDRRSRLRALPATLSDAEALTITGHLNSQAIEAVAEAPPSQRTISFLAATRPQVTVLRTRHRGKSVAPLSGSVLLEAVAERWGTVRIERSRESVTTTVEIPSDVHPRLPGGQVAHERPAAGVLRPVPSSPGGPAAIDGQDMAGDARRRG